MLFELIQKETAFLPVCMSDTGGFISVFIAVTQNDLRVRLQAGDT